MNEPHESDAVAPISREAYQDSLEGVIEEWAFSRRLPDKPATGTIVPLPPPDRTRRYYLEWKKRRGL